MSRREQWLHNMRRVLGPKWKDISVGPIQVRFARAKTGETLLFDEANDQLTYHYQNPKDNRCSFSLVLPTMAGYLIPEIIGRAVRSGRIAAEIIKPAGDVCFEVWTREED